MGLDRNAYDPGLFWKDFYAIYMDSSEHNGDYLPTNLHPQAHL